MKSQMRMPKRRKGANSARRGGLAPVGSKGKGKFVAHGAVQQIISGSPMLPLPQALRLQFTCEADYKIPIATASITSGAVKLNSPWLPFRPGGSSAFGSFTFQGPATELTLLPTGWSNLATATLYQSVKVLRSTIQLRWNGSNSGNNVVATVFPHYNSFTPADVYVARTLPYAKQATFSVSKPNTGVDSEGWMTLTCDPYVFIGLNRPEAKADLFIQNATFDTDPNTVLWWHVYLQSNDLDVSSTTASLFQVRVRYDVELFQMSAMSVT